MPIASIFPKHVSRLLVLACIWGYCCWLSHGSVEETTSPGDDGPAAVDNRATGSTHQNNNNIDKESHDGLEVTTTESEDEAQSQHGIFQQENGLWVLESFADVPELIQTTTDRDPSNPPHASIILLLVHGEDCAWTNAAIEKMEQAQEILYTAHKRNDNHHHHHHHHHHHSLAKMSYDHFLISNIENGKDLTDLQEAFETIPFVCLLVQDSHERVEVLTLPSSSMMMTLQPFPSAHQLVQYVRHYHHRLVATTERVYASKSSPTAAASGATSSTFPAQFFVGPLLLETTKHVQDFVCQQLRNEHSGLLSLDRPAVAVLPPGTPFYELATLESLVPSHDQLLQEDSVVFVQCRRQQRHTDSNDQDQAHEAKRTAMKAKGQRASDTRSNDHDQKTVEALYDAFSQLHTTMLPRSNLMYVSVTDCEVDGSIWAWRISPQTTCDNANDDDGLWLEMPPFKQSSNSESTSEALDALIQFHHIQASPSIMWYDPQIAAALAFPKFRKIHAFLFVDIHSAQLGEASKEFMQRQTALIHEFSNLCTKTRRQMMERKDFAVDKDDLTCLIMPSTETRWLTTMDVDPWSAIDKKIMDIVQFGAIQDDGHAPLPRFVMTDRRRPEGGIVRYSLHNPTPDTLQTFVSDFWEGSLQPDPKTSTPLGEASKPKTATNIHRVQAIQGGQKNFAEVIRENRASFRHMFILFVSPTCGHCKRLSSIFNRVAQLLYQQAAGTGWESLMGLYTLDVSSEDTTLVDQDLHFSVRWLPEIAYLSPHRDDIVYFNSPNQKSLAGNLNHYAGLMEWILDVLDVPDAEIRNLLASVQKLQKARNQ